MTASSDMKLAVEEMRRVIRIEEQPQPGLFTWHQMRTAAWVAAFEAMKKVIPADKRGS